MSPKRTNRKNPNIPKQQIVHSLSPISGYRWKVGDRVEVRDRDSDEWKPGVIEQIKPEIKVKRDGWDKAFHWKQIRAQLKVGERVEVRDKDSDEWKPGVIVQIKPEIKVMRDGWDKAFHWKQIRATGGSRSQIIQAQKFLKAYNAKNKNALHNYFKTFEDNEITSLCKLVKIKNAAKNSRSVNTNRLIHKIRNNKNSYLDIFEMGLHGVFGIASLVGALFFGKKYAKMLHNKIKDSKDIDEFISFRTVDEYVYLREFPFVILSLGSFTRRRLNAINKKQKDMSLKKKTRPYMIQNILTIKKS